MTFPIELMAAATAPTRLDPLELFLDADIVVQVVMVGLVLASVWTWTIIVSFALATQGRFVPGGYVCMYGQQRASGS